MTWATPPSKPRHAAAVVVLICVIQLLSSGSLGCVSRSVGASHDSEIILADATIPNPADASAGIDATVPEPDSGFVDCPSPCPPRMFVSERYAGHVWIYHFDTQTADVYPLGMEAVDAAVTPAGELFVALYQDGAIAKVAPDGASHTVALSGVHAPHGLWYDVVTQSLLVTLRYEGTVVEFDPNTGARSTLVANITEPTMALRRPGSSIVYIADRAEHAVKRFDATTNQLDVVASVSRPNALLLGLPDVLYVTGRDGDFHRIDISTGTNDLLAAGLQVPMGLCHDPAGGAIFVVLHDWQVGRYDLTTGTMTEFFSQPELAWGCVIHAPADADLDGHFSIYYGGFDCDDEDPSLYPGSGCEAP